MKKDKRKDKFHETAEYKAYLDRFEAAIQTLSPAELDRVKEVLYAVKLKGTPSGLR